MFSYSEISGPCIPAFRLNTERLRFSPFSVRVQENADQRNSKYGHFLHSDWSKLQLNGMNLFKTLTNSQILFFLCRFCYLLLQDVLVFIFPSLHIHFFFNCFSFSMNQLDFPKGIKYVQCPASATQKFLSARVKLHRNINAVTKGKKIKQNNNSNKTEHKKNQYIDLKRQ